MQAFFKSYLYHGLHCHLCRQSAMSFGLTMPGRSASLYNSNGYGKTKFSVAVLDEC